MTEQYGPDARSQLEEVSQSLREIASSLKSNHDKSKDKWDKFNALSPFVTALVVAIVGGLFTFSQERHNEILKQQEMQDSQRQAAQDAARKDQEAHILELQTIAQLMPYLTSKNEHSKQVAITAINELASTQLAVELAKLNRSPGTINAIRQIAAQSGKEGDRKLAQAALVELESSTSGPNKTVLKTEEGDCGPEGMGGDKATNLLKNRTDVPTAFRDVAVQDMAQMQIVDVPLQRDTWTADDIDKVVRMGDGSGIRLQGYMIAAKREGGTTANCKSTNYTDWHLVLGSSSDSDTKHSVIAVVGPRIRILHPNWTLDRFRKLVAAKVPVRISGWLFFDQSHLRTPMFWGTLWEIRPAVKIELLKNQTWLDVDDSEAMP